MHGRHQEVSPRFGDKLTVGVVARITGRPNQKEQSLEDQVAHARSVVAEIYRGDVDLRVVATVGKGEYLGRPELAEIEAIIRSRELDLLICEDLGRIVRGIEAVRLVGIAVDHGVRVIAPNDGFDTINPNFEQDAMRASEGHVAHNAHTSKRISQKQMNRFLEHGGSIPREILGYDVAGDAKYYDQWSKVEAATPVYVEWFQMLEGGGNFSDVARWLNKKGIPTGPYADNLLWDGRAVGRVTRNPILKGLATRGRKRSVKHHESGRRRPVCNPEGPKTRDFPHLAHIEPATWDRVNALMTERNAGLGRKPRRGRDPRAGVSRKSTLWPGQHVVCGVCGRIFYWGGHGANGQLMCSGARDYKCWVGASFNGADAAKKISAALLRAVESLPGFDEELKAKLETEAALQSTARLGELKALEADASHVRRVIDNLAKSIGEMGGSKTLQEKLSEAEQKQALLERRRHQLSRVDTAPVLLPPLEVVKANARTILGSEDFADDQFRRTMRQLLPKIEIFPCRLLDGGAVRLRAISTIQLVPLAPDHRRALELLPAQVITIDLFDSVQRAAYGARVVAMRQSGRTEKAVADALGLTITAAQRAKTLHARARAEGRTDAYVYIKEPPLDCRKKARHLNESYSFQPLPGYPTGPCGPDPAA